MRAEGLPVFSASAVTRRHAPKYRQSRTYLASTLLSVNRRHTILYAIIHGKSAAQRGETEGITRHRRYIAPGRERTAQPQRPRCRRRGRRGTWRARGATSKASRSRSDCGRASRSSATTAADCAWRSAGRTAPAGPPATRSTSSPATWAWVPPSSSAWLRHASGTGSWRGR